MEGDLHTDNGPGMWQRLTPVLVLTACIAAVAVLLSLLGCRRSHAPEGKVAVTFEPQATVAAALTGDPGSVVTLLKAGSNPETYDPTMSDMTALQGADIYFTLNTPGFERGALRRVSDNYPGLRIVDASEGLEIITGTHGHAHSHGDGHDHGDGGDPHLWTSVRNMRQMIPVMAEALVNSDPALADSVGRRAMLLTDRLQALDDSIAALLRPVRGATFVVMHPSLSYFARDYGLRQMPMETEGKEASPRQLQARLDSAAARRPLLMVVEAGHNPEQGAAMARQLGLDTLQISLNSPAWESELLRLATALRDRSDRRANTTAK